MRWRWIASGLIPIVAPTGGTVAMPAAQQAEADKPIVCPLSAPYRTDNAFARILRHEIPASIIAEDARVMAIVPIDWKRPGHALVIPKAPVRNLYELSDRDMLAACGWPNAWRPRSSVRWAAPGSRCSRTMPSASMSATFTCTSSRTQPRTPEATRPAPKWTPSPGV